MEGRLRHNQLTRSKSPDRDRVFGDSPVTYLNEAESGNHSIKLEVSNPRSGSGLQNGARTTRTGSEGVVCVSEIAPTTNYPGAAPAGKPHFGIAGEGPREISSMAFIDGLQEAHCLRFSFSKTRLAFDQVTGSVASCPVRSSACLPGSQQKEDGFVSCENRIGVRVKGARGWKK